MIQCVMAFLMGLACAVPVWAEAGSEPATPTAVKAPAGSTTEPAEGPAASQPAESIVLFRLGDRLTVTQADWNLAAGVIPIQEYDRKKINLLKTIAEERAFELWLEDHPEVVTPQMIEDRLAYDAKAAKLGDVAGLEAELNRQGVLLDTYKKNLRLILGWSALSKRAEAMAKDEDAARQVFEAEKPFYDGTIVEARHLLLTALPTTPPEECATKIAQLQAMREDILADRRTWEECVALTDSAALNGNLGRFTRHGMLNDFLARRAFEMQVGETSGVFRTAIGFHVLQVLDRTPGTKTLEEIKDRLVPLFSSREYGNAIFEAFTKYPLVGGQFPAEPPNLPSLLLPDTPRTQPATQPTGTRPAAVQPRRRVQRPTATQSATQPAHPAADNSAQPTSPAP